MKRKFVIFLILLSTLAVVVGYGILNYSFSNGARSGKLVKLSRKGLLLKTYEGTLDLGSGDLLTWNFSIHDIDLGEQLAKHTGKNVRLEYRELLHKIFYNTKYDVISWSFEGSSSTAGNDGLCRLVKVLRHSKEIVQFSKTLIEKYDPDLLHDIRACQN